MDNQTAGNLTRALNDFTSRIGKIYIVTNREGKTIAERQIEAIENQASAIEILTEQIKLLRETIEAHNNLVATPQGRQYTKNPSQRI